MSVGQESSPDSTETPPSGEAEEVSAGEGSVPAGGPSATGRVTRRCLARWRPILATALVIATIAVAAGLYFLQYRPAQRLNDAATHQAVQAASDGAVAVVSYSYDHLDHDFAQAKSLSTGEFLSYYSKFSQDFIAPAARQGHLIATAKVLRAAAIELHPDSAVVLVFMNQNTASKEKPQPLTTASSVVVTLNKVNGSWLIAKLEPL
jgi:Mce-associated membrane protein